MIRRRPLAALALGGLMSAAPAAASTPPPARGRAFIVFFETWSAALDDAALAGLDRIAALAAEHPDVPVLVEGFTGPQGSQGANELLGQLRARMVFDALVERGVPAERLRMVGRGIVPGFDSLESRRVEVRVDDQPR